MKCLKIIMKNISKLISILFLTFSLLLLIYVFYRSEFYHSGTRFDYYLKYYVFTCVLVILSIISFFIGKETKTKLTIALVSSIFGLYLIEIYFFIDPKQFGIWKSGVQYDKRSKLQIYEDLKLSGKDVSLSIPIKANIEVENLYPLSGVSNILTILCNENGYYSLFTSDRYGFNNQDEIWEKKEIDFLLIGDSFTIGECVWPDKNISGNLKLLTNKNIINLGKSGGNPLTEFATLREYLPLINVKKVIWLYFEGNDLEFVTYINNNILIKYLEDKNFTQNLSMKQNRVDLINKRKIDRQNEFHKNAFYLNKQKLSKFVKMFALRHFLNTIFTKLSNNNSQNLQKISPEFKKIIRLANEFVEKNNAKFYFVYLPSINRYKFKQDHVNFNDYAKVKDYVSSLEVPVICMDEEIFSKHDDPLSLFPFRSEQHYNPEGYRLVSEMILNKI